MHSSLSKNTLQQKLNKIVDPTYSLCREDVIWMLEYIKKKMDEGDPIMDLTEPNQMNNFRHFAEISLQLIHRRPVLDLEMEPLKAWIHASYLREQTQ